MESDEPQANSLHAGPTICSSCRDATFDGFSRNPCEAIVSASRFPRVSLLLCCSCV